MDAQTKESEVAMGASMADFHATEGQAKRVFKSAAKVCQEAHDITVAIIHSDPFFATEPALKALNACRRKSAQASKTPAASAAQVAFLEVGAGAGCKAALLAAQSARPSTFEEAAQPEPIDLVDVATPLMAKKDAAAVKLSACLVLLNSKLVAKKNEAIEIRNKEVGEAKRNHEEFTSQANGVRDAAITASKKQRTTAAGVFAGAKAKRNAAENDLRSKSMSLQKMTTQFTAQLLVKAGTLKSVEDRAAISVAAVTKKAQKVFGKNTKPLEKLEDAEQKEAAEDCTARRKSLDVDADLIDSIEKAVHRMEKMHKVEIAAANKAREERARIAAEAAQLQGQVDATAPKQG